MTTFNSPTDVNAGTLAKSAHINDLDAATAAAFALLPDETLLKNGTVNYAVDTGIASAYLISLAVAPASYADGLLVVMKPLNSNSGDSTINVNSLGIKYIKQSDGTALSVGDITAGVPVALRYSSTTGYFHFEQTDTHAVYDLDQALKDRFLI